MAGAALLLVRLVLLLFDPNDADEVVDGKRSGKLLVGGVIGVCCKNGKYVSNRLP